jgi:hypothetical protein
MNGRKMAVYSIIKVNKDGAAYSKVEAVYLDHDAAYDHYKSLSKLRSDRNSYLLSVNEVSA